MDTLAVLAQKLVLAFDPLAAALESDAAMRDFLADLGWDFATPPDALETLEDPVAGLAPFRDVDEIPAPQIPALLAAVSSA